MTVLVQKTFSTTCTGDLHQAIQDNVTIVTNLEQIVYAGGATTDFYFANALSGPEDTELDNVLAAWVCPTPSDTQVDDQEFDDTASADPNVVWSSDKTETEYVNETGDSMEGNLDMDGAEVRIHKTGDFGNYWSLGFNAATGAPEIGRSNTSGTMILMPDSPNCQWIFGSNAAGTIATYIDCDNNGKLRFNTLHTGSIVIGLGGLEAYNNATPIGASGSPFGSAFVTNLDVEVDGQIDGNLRIGEGFASTHTLSVQSNTADTHIEILNNGGTGKGALLGMENSLTVNDLGIYNYQSGPICFYTDTSDSSGQRRMVIQPDGDVEIKSLTAGAVKSAADGTLSSDAAITDLSDVFSSMSPNDGEVLTYDTTNGWQAEIPSSGVTDHGLLSGLGDDDHVQYHNDTRGDARYYTKTQVDALTWDASDIVSGTFDNARIAASNVTQHVGAIDHDSLLNFVADEHIDWTVDQGATNIESNNIDVGRSIVVAGGELRLDGDLVSPGNDKVYGTNGSGVKGWYDAPTAAVWGNITGTLSNQTDLQTALDGKADSSHTHAASEVTSGTFADARISESSVTQHEGAIDHDALTNFVAAEHIRWDLTGAEDIHVDRITAGAVTQHEASIDHDALTNTHNLTTDIDHDSLTNYVAQEHIRWDLTGAEDVHVDRITAGAVTQHEGSIDHDALTNFVANEHVDHSSITITAGNGLTGGGTIDSNVTINANTQNSVEVSVDALQLVGDTASPGNNKVYGTNGSGTRGWYDAASGTGDVTAAANIVDHSIIRGDGGAKGVQDSEQGTTSWTIADNGKMVGVGDNSGDYIMTIRNLNASSGSGFSVQAGEVLGDLAFSIQDSDGSFIIMECEADQGYVTFGKSYAQTLTDNGVVYGVDNQLNATTSKDFNCQNGTYRIGGVDIVVPAGGTTGQVLEKASGTDYDMQWQDMSMGGAETTLSAWTLVSGDLYRADFTHNLNTQCIALFYTDTGTDKQVIPEDVEVIDNNTVRTFVRGNTHSIKICVVTGRGPQGPQGPAGDNEITLEEGGAAVTNTPHGTLDFDGDDFNVTDNGDGSATVELASTTKTMVIPHTWAISGEIAVASGDDDFLIPFSVPVPSGQTVKLVEARHFINSGTNCNVKVQRNGVDATGFTNITVTTTPSSTNPADITLANHDRLALVVNSVSGTPKNLSFTLYLEYTV